MDLSEQQFAQITGVSDAPPLYDPQSIDPAADDRRKHPRVAFGTRARIFPLIESAGSSGCPVLVRDISRSGLGFLFSHPLSRGDEFIIHLPTGEGPIVRIHCMAQRCELGGTGGKHYVIGATFELVLETLPEAPQVKPSTDADHAFAVGADGWPVTPEEAAADAFEKPSVWSKMLSVVTVDRSAARIRKRLKQKSKAQKKAEKANSETTPATSRLGSGVIPNLDLPGVTLPPGWTSADAAKSSTPSSAGSKDWKGSIFLRKGEIEPTIEPVPLPAPVVETPAAAPEAPTTVTDVPAAPVVVETVAPVVPVVEAPAAVVQQPIVPQPVVEQPAVEMKPVAPIEAVIAPATLAGGDAPERIVIVDAEIPQTSIVPSDESDIEWPQLGEESPSGINRGTVVIARIRRRAHRRR